MSQINPLAMRAVRDEAVLGNPWVVFFSRCVMAAIALVLAQWILLPGFIAIDVPSHSDLWRYYATAHELPLRVVLTSPRPLMLLFLHILAPIDSARLLFCVLNVPALVFVAAAVAAGERLARIRVNAPAAFLAFFTLFGTATFYELNPLDYGGMLAGVFVAVLTGWFAVERDRAAADAARPLIQSMVVTGLLTYLSVETKPTFALLLPVLPLILYRRYPIRKILILCGVAVAFLVLSVVKDLLLKSPFIQVGGGNSPYKVASSPLAIASAAGFYIARIVPLTLLPIAAMLFYRAWKVQGRAAIAILVASLLAVLPMCAIPARLTPMYSWFGLAVLVSLLIPYVAWTGSRVAMRIGLVAAISLGLCAAALGKQPDKKVTNWVIANHRFNEHALQGLEALQSRILPGERLLVAGPLAPFNPFKNDSFISLTTPVAFNWAVAYPPSDKALVDLSQDSHVHIPVSDVDFSRFDRVAIFDAEGRLSTLAPSSQFMDLASDQVASRFYCPSALAEPDNETRAMKVVICLNQFGEYGQAAAFGERLGNASANQWLWYERGKASEALGKMDDAEAYYARAASIEKAAVFEDAVKRVHAAK